ncbi:PPIC-type PPIASE family protein [Sphaerochaeta pleomorpha str. Grapes]|uniref:peptidylprolyl isomerase n=1 Tax=Sphaerochaeta pleomorpha (strain ATCC BAA-1885 / DSM 22778 / Grapes) TaxID=158190 RepID=G8QS33_SPHPG|nr:peptidylprolyl isomerase [Sphaerochaeta pleomorpha]AEV28894.1 PPIC-type PPIASE family protein [Sphaerochaeta pleomorpha str. Grapes]
MGTKRFMMSSNDDTTEKKTDGVSKENKSVTIKKNGDGAKDQKAMAIKPKKKVTIGWVMGMIILILIAISFVLAPAIEALVGRNQSNEIVFGQYGKDNIKYTSNNYFYDQVQSYASQYKTTDGNSTQTLYQIWKSAYDSTVIFTAVNQMAKKLNIIAADEVVNRAIINSGSYNKDGKFDVDTFQKASAETKASIDRSIRRAVPYQIVVDDIGSVLSSEAEADYVSAMSADNRTFRYVSLDASLYPDQKASEYALMNKQLFYSMDLSVISVETEEEATTLASAIASGEKTFEAAATESSKDSYAEAEGKVGNIFYYGLLPNIKDAEKATQFLTAKSGDVIGPVESNSGWALYRLNSDPEEADYTNPATLSSVKAYLAYNDEAIISDYLSSLADQFAADAANGFDEAAEKANLTVNEVGATPLNISSSQYLNSFTNTDAKGLLASVATDEATGKLLFSEPVGSIVKPIKNGSAYLVVKVETETQDEGMSNYVKMFYNYLSSSQNQQDLAQAVFASDNFKDNFLTTFLNVIIGNSSN